jgi:hypothetical protein
LIDDLEDFEDIPSPPPPEFDRDAEFALASPGLTSEERARIVGEARSLAASRIAREALGNWICREVARTVGGPSGFDAYDADGNVIDPPYIAAARKKITSRAGQKSQAKRNAVVELWSQRCKQMVAAGQSENQVFDLAWRAMNFMQLRASGKPVAAIPAQFEDLPLFRGRDGSSLPKDKKRLRARLFGKYAEQKSH